MILFNTLFHFYYILNVFKFLTCFNGENKMYPFISNQNCTMHAWLLTYDVAFQWWSLQSSCVCVCLLHRRNGTDAPGAVCAVTNVRWSDCCQPRQSMCLSFSINICDLTWLDFNTDDNALTFFPSLSMLQDLYYLSFFNKGCHYEWGVC